MWQMGNLSSKWDPSKSSDWDSMKASAICVSRMTKDLKQMIEEEGEDDLDIYVYPNDNDLTKMLALIVGPADTPYDGGFFQFYVRVSPDYPITPPRVRNLTTDDSTVRFGPNFYNDGKICLSILGTFPGPSWTPIMNVGGVLKSIQSLMCTAALRNEPSYEKRHEKDQQVVDYDKIIRHETIRVAVLANVQQAIDATCQWPFKFRELMTRRFVKQVPLWIKVCEENCHMDGSAMNCIYGQSRSPFRWNSMKKEMVELTAKAHSFVDRLDLTKERLAKSGKGEKESK